MPRLTHILISVSLLLCIQLQGQTSVFRSEIEKILHSTDEIKQIEEKNAESTPFDPLKQNLNVIENLIYAEIARESKKEKFKIQKSEILSKLAKASTTAWKGSHYADKKKWNSLEKHFKRVKLKLTTNFNLFESFSFTIPLINNAGKKYHCDRKIPKGEMYLFYGKKLPKKEDEQADPLSFYEQTELVELAMTKLNQNNCVSKIRKGIYRFVGISVELNEKSLYKNAIPTARVVIFFGANRLQKIRV